jgi:hypothetical protein
MMTGRMEKLNTRSHNVHAFTSSRDIVAAASDHPTRRAPCSRMVTQLYGRLRVSGRPTHAHHAELDVSGRRGPVLVILRRSGRSKPHLD